MGNKIDNFKTPFQYWANLCNRFAHVLPFFSQTLWQVGPPTWMLNNFNQSLFNFSTPQTYIGDSFHRTSSSGKVKKEEKNEIPEDAKEIKIDNKSYYIHIKDNTTTYYDSEGKK